MPSLFDRIYAKSPVLIQNLGISLYGYLWKSRRFGGQFEEFRKAFLDREAYNYGEWAEYQRNELRRILVLANRHTLYYRERFTSLGISEVDLKHFSVEDITGLPLLEKNDLRIRPKDFLSDFSRPGRLFTYHTSGTTGSPVAIRMSSLSQRKWAGAYEVRVRNWAGVDNRMRRVMIGGRIVVPRANAHPPFWRYNMAERQLYMSAFHISPTNACHYNEAIKRFKPDYLVGYASSHYFLARMILEQGLIAHQPRAVLLSSEKLTNEMREVIESVYGCPVFDGYSGVEACCLASECEHGNLHVSPDVGLIEIIGELGRPVAPGEVGEIVATGFLNLDQPLIRYRTGDLASVSYEQCACGRQMPILKELVGRLEDTVIGVDGRETVRFHGIFTGIPHIREGQVIQNNLKDFHLKLVVDPEFSREDIELIEGRFFERLGEIDLKIEKVDRIERTERGKFRAVISKVQRKQATR